MQRVERIPLGIADVDGRTGYIALPQNALEAIDLSSGDILWRVEDSLVPLASDGGRVLVRREDRLPYVLALEVLDATDGHLISRLEPIALPHWVDLRDEQTSLDAIIDESGAFTVRWAAEPRYHGGAPPSKSLAMASEAPQDGAFRIDASGEVAAAEAARPEPTALVDQASVGSRVLTLTPDATLEARDRDSGEKMWEKSLLGPVRPPKLRP